MLVCRKVGSNIQQLVCFTVELIKRKESEGKLWSTKKFATVGKLSYLREILEWGILARSKWEKLSSKLL